METHLSTLELDSNKTLLRLNPRMPEHERQVLVEMLTQAAPPEGLIWITSSGSSGPPKLVGLSRRAILASAQAVNEHLQATKDDVWLLSLPTFHVGGIGVLARARLSQSRTVMLEQRWSPEAYHQLAELERVTLSALVPTQLYDLVQLGKPAPASIRAIVIGGDALLPALYEQARKLGYPVLPSYGLSECCSQVATATLQSLTTTQSTPQPTLLNHVQCELSDDEALRIKSAALLEGYIVIHDRVATFLDPKTNGWFQTNDRARIFGNQLEILGRLSNVVKVFGEQVNLERLTGTLRAMSPECEAVVSAVADRRAGHRIVLVSPRITSLSQLERLRTQFNDSVSPFERIQDIRFVDAIPRTALGKVQWASLTRLLASYRD